MLKQVVEVRLQWVVKDRLNGLLRVLSKPNTSPAMSNHTIPLHCREANFWLDASATNVGYVGFTGSHLGCILLNFKALLSHHSWSPGTGLWYLQLPWTILAMEWTRRPFKNDPRQAKSNLHLLKLREEQVPQAVKDSVIRAYVQV